MFKIINQPGPHILSRAGEVVKAFDHKRGSPGFESPCGQNFRDNQVRKNAGLMMYLLPEIDFLFQND